MRIWQYKYRLIGCAAFCLLLGTTGAYAQYAVPGGICSPSGILANSNGFLTCTGGVWVANPVSIGSTAASCASGLAGQLRWTGSAFQGCNGTSWATLGSSGLLNLGSSVTAANPQISGDATSGLYTPAGSTVAIVTGGTERLRVTSTGNIGIGTTSPAYPLTIISTQSGNNLWVESNQNVDSIILNNSQTGGRKWGLLSTGGSSIIPSSFALQDVTSGSYMLGINSSDSVGIGGSITPNTLAGADMVLLSTGNVGIGTASPNANAVLDLSANTNGMLLPVGTTGQEPTCSTATQGEMRYNRSTGFPEFCNGSAWIPFKATGAPSGSGYFVLAGTAFNGCLTAGIASITYSGTTATLTTSGNHYLANGASVIISGTTPSAYSGTFTITVTGATTFTYTMASSPGGNATTVGSMCSGAGGLTQANALCLSDLTANTGWWGYATANAAGLLTSSHVTAFLCDGTTCNNAEANTNYYYATALDSTSGGAYFTTNSSGLGPNDSSNPLYWVLGSTFGGLGSGNITTGRGSGSTYLWPNTSASTNCTGWTTNSSSVSGEYGIANANYNSRWNAHAYGCNSTYPVICFINP